MLTMLQAAHSAVCCYELLPIAGWLIATLAPHLHATLFHHQPIKESEIWVC
jgi:hypothetical protein